MHDKPEHGCQRRGKLGVGQPVPGAPAIWDRFDEAASAQAGELVGHHLAGNAERVGEVGGVRRGFTQRQHDPRSGVIRQRVGEACERGGVRQSHGRSHITDDTWSAVFTEW